MTAPSSAPLDPTVRPSADRSRWTALFVLCTGLLMIILDQTIVNVALPSVQDDLGFTQSNLAWVVNAYMIAFGGLLLLAGRLGDMIGRKRMFLIGLVIFTAASLACGVAQNAEMLIAARFAQGLGGAMTAAVILGMIVTMFPAPADQAKAIGIYSFVAAGGGALGLLAGGVLTEALNWHWVFVVNVPIGIATAVAAVRLIEHDEGIGLANGADLPGALLMVSALMLAVYTIVEATEYGWLSLHTVGLGSLAVALTVAFVIRESRARTPLIPLRIFRSRQVSAANAAQALIEGGLFAMFFLGALYMQRVLGYGPIDVGLAFLPAVLTLGALSLGVAARLIVRFGAGAIVIPSLVLIAAGLVLFALVPVDADYVTHLLTPLLLIGVGSGLFFPSVMTLAMSGATAEDSGLASGLVNTTQQLGGALGLAVLATLATGRTEDLVAGGEDLAPALTSGYHLAFWVAAGFVIAALAVAVVWLRPASEHVRGHEPDVLAPALVDERE